MTKMGNQLKQINRYSIEQSVEKTGIKIGFVIMGIIIIELLILSFRI
jgi:hypothetical protein